MFFSAAHSELVHSEDAQFAQFGEVLPFDCEALCKRVGQDSELRLVVLAAPASRLFAACLAEGMVADDAQRWVRARAQDILKLFRRARRQVLILPYEVSWLPPSLVSSAANSYFEDRTQPVFSIDVADMPEPVPLSLLYRLVGAAAVEASPTLKRLDQELQASMGRVERHADALQSEVEIALGGLTDLARCAGSVPQQLAGIDEGPVTALDAQRVLVADLQDALIACQSELEWYHRLASRRGGGLEQRRLAVEHKAAVQERERLRAELSDQAMALEWSKRDAEQLRDALTQIKSSTSWKVTGPLRKMRGRPVSDEVSE